MFVEDVTHDPPGEVIKRGRRRDLAAAAEDEGSGEVAEWSTREGASEDVKENGSQCAGQPEVLEVDVDRSRRKDALRTDETPDDGGVEKDSTVGAVELVGLVLGANICNGAAKSPLEDCDLDDASPNCGDSLRHEHGTPWYLHVLAQF